MPAPSPDPILTANKAAVALMICFRLVHDRVVELWEDFDEFGLGLQLAAA